MHSLIFVSVFLSAKRINSVLAVIGNLAADGWTIPGLDVHRDRKNNSQKTSFDGVFL